jgi:outer membrane protein assembly factor BamE
MNMPNSPRRLVVVLFLALMLTACAQFGVYRLDIQQGNLVTQEQLSKVKPGMTRIDVRNILGTPLLQDAFNGNRWDYAYSDDRNTERKLNPFGREKQKYTVTVLFDNEKVTRIEGEASPVEILTGGGERRKTPNFIPPNAPPDPKK